MYVITRGKNCVTAIKTYLRNTCKSTDFSAKIFDLTLCASLSVPRDVTLHLRHAHAGYGSAVTVLFEIFIYNVEVDIL